MTKTKKGPVFTEIALEIFKLGGLLVNEGDLMGSPYGITSARWKIMGAIVRAGKPLTVPQIAKTMGLTRQAVQRLVDVMYADGVLAFQTNPEHKRAKLIKLSEVGEEIYGKLDKKQVDWAQTCSIHLTKQELDTTLSVLKKMADMFDH
ncbi:MarR family winged helix-turn-helix transcriptional regulator [Zooshikella harenae]|uniref:MarR family transcriptional regulator n=1 Tax=Zooshikella harenae TaxID=2827238 RepID=A0ABS5Z9J4_9GAMM|nr:MarR family transcriptional regulator [Zooshikella harenae]MBU2710724.1 MarR family transcriptional regulator [Zooshikella harenae]